MRTLSRWIYKLFGVYTIIHICDLQYNILKRNVKLKFLPKYNDLIYFDYNGDYFLVVKVVHYIKDRHEIWVVTQRFTNNINNFNKKNNKNLTNY